MATNSNSNSSSLAGALDGFFEALGATQTMANPKALPTLRRGFRRTLWSPPAWTKVPDLTIDYAVYDAQPGRRDDIGQLSDPEYPASAEVQAVYLGRVDIYGLLSEDILQAIETYCAAGCIGDDD